MDTIDISLLLALRYSPYYTYVRIEHNTLNDTNTLKLDRLYVASTILAIPITFTKNTKRTVTVALFMGTESLVLT